MNLPDVIGPILVEYRNADGGLTQTSVTWRKKVSRTYDEDGYTMNVVGYESFHELARDIALVANSSSGADAVVKATTMLAGAIAKYDMVRNANDGGDLELTKMWPINGEMLEGFENGEYSPRGFCAMLRYIAYDRWETTTLAFEKSYPE